VAQVAERVPSKRKVLSSNSSTAKKKKKSNSRVHLFAVHIFPEGIIYGICRKTLTYRYRTVTVLIKVKGCYCITGD
jgi:hypothetical protein